MSPCDGLVSKLLTMPNEPDVGCGTLLHETARAHRALLSRAAHEAPRHDPAGRELAELCRLLEQTLSATLCERFLVDPAFVEGLHESAGVAPSLADWHVRVADPDEIGSPPATGRLGNLLLPLLLRDDPFWLGELLLQTDLAGRLRFPLCDWSIALRRKGESPEPLARQCIACTLDRRNARFALPGRSGEALLAIPRREWLRLVVANEDRLDGRQFRYPAGDIDVRLDFADALPGWHVRYDPAGVRDIERHAGLTGGIVLACLNAITHHAPRIAAEFDDLVCAVRSWDLAPSELGLVQSFSDPSLPRVMGFNVPYTEGDEPQVCPFCFTWFGHEMGHTKSYLIETILYSLGCELTTAHGEYTGTIARYGRKLRVRTLLQIPYTHLYEWVLLMRFLENGFAELPWEIVGDPLAHAADIQSEIEESLERIGREAPLTNVGRAHLARLRELYSEAERRWKSSPLRAIVS